MSANLAQRFVEAGGYRTAYVEAGVGDAVVCIHSANPGSTGALEYRHNLEPLNKRFRVIAPDLIGAGRTEPPTASIPNMHDAYVAHLFAFLDALGIVKAHLIGNSRGALICISMAAKQPARVGRMILLGNAGGGLEPAFEHQSRAAFANFRPDRESLRAWLGGTYFSLERSVPPDVFDAYLEGSIRECEAWRPLGGLRMDVPDLRPALTSIQVPVLFIFGKEDKRWPPLPRALEVFVNTPGSRFYVLSECGHHPQSEHPDEFNLLATHFLRGDLA